MDGRISAGDWSLLLIPLGTPLYALLCAQLGQRIAYRRGYLKRGYILGLLGGPLGLLACLALPRIPEPLLEIEAMPHYGTDDPQSRRWRGSLKWTFILMLYLGLLWLSLPGWVPARVDWFTPPLDLATRWWLHLPVLLGGAAFCWYSFSRRAQPPLHFLYPLPGAAGPGMGELLHWTTLRHYIARQEQQEKVLIYCCAALFAAAAMLLLVVGVSLLDESFNWQARGLLIGFMLAAVLTTFLLLRRLGRLRVWLLQTRQQAARELGADPLMDIAPVLYHFAPGSRPPLELLQRLDDKVRAILDDSRGLAGSRATIRPLAAATLDAEASTRRLLFLKPAAALGGGYLAFKLFVLVFQGGRAAEIFSNGWDELQHQVSSGPRFVTLALAFVLGLMLLLLFLTWAQRYLLRRRREQDPD